MNHTPPLTSGASSKPPNGPHAVKRRKPQNDPFFAKRTPAQPRKPLVNGRPAPTVNGSLAPPTQVARPATPNSQRSTSPPKTVIPEAERLSGFSDPRVTAESIPYKDYKLVTTKRELLSGLRYHLLHLPGDNPIDIRNEAEFSKPARLHRRDPRTALLGQVKEETDDPRDGLNQEEREDLNKRKEIRQKEREANLAQVAPSQGASKKLNNFKKKTQQVFKPDYTSEEKRKIQTNYEEKLPWHLEDFDNKHCFVGQNQIGSAHVHAAFVYEPTLDSSSGKFRMIPIEKVYHFKPKRDPKIAMVTIEEAEAQMKKRSVEPEGLTRQREARMAEASKERLARQAKGLFSGAQTATIAGRSGEDADLDFDEDFADDEEGDLFLDKDEDEKLAEKKIKEDQLQANFLDFKDEKEYDNAEEREKKEAEARKKNFRDIRRALERRERNYNHGSDSEKSYGTSVSLCSTSSTHR
jgi:transcription initiation factor TFIIF subunit alpha